MSMGLVCLMTELVQSYVDRDWALDEFFLIVNFFIVFIAKLGNPTPQKVPARS